MEFGSAAELAAGRIVGVTWTSLSASGVSLLPVVTTETRVQVFNVSCESDGRRRSRPAARARRRPRGSARGHTHNRWK